VASAIIALIGLLCAAVFWVHIYDGRGLDDRIDDTGTFMDGMTVFGSAITVGLIYISAAIVVWIGVRLMRAGSTKPD